MKNYIYTLYFAQLWKFDNRNCNFFYLIRKRQKLAKMNNVEPVTALAADVVGDGVTVVVTAGSYFNELPNLILQNNIIDRIIYTI